MLRAFAKQKSKRDVPTIRILIALATTVMEGSVSVSDAKMVRLPFGEIVRSAQVILIGTVTSRNSDSDDNMIHTNNVISVEQIIKGISTQTTYVIRTKGGSVGETAIYAEDEPRFVEGERVILFLGQQGGNFYCVGKFQGKFSVKNNRVLRGSEPFGTLSEFVQRINNIR